MDLQQLRQARLVDLTVTLSERLPCTWPGHMTFAHKNWNWFAEVDQATGRTRSAAPYQTHFIIIDEHCGTHFDAPTHFIPPAGSGLPWASELGAQTGDKVPLQDLMGPAAVIDVRFLQAEGKPGISPFITPAHIQAWEQQHGAIQPGDVVLLFTGWDRYYVEGPEGAKYAQGALVTGTFAGWPAPGPEAVRYLHDRGVKCIGIDAPSIGAAHEGAPAHWEGLSRAIRYVELLTNLGELPPRGAFFQFLPIKIAGSTGGPGRAIAWIF